MNTKSRQNPLKTLQRAKSSCGGFSLIELLTVVAIMGILAGMSALGLGSLNSSSRFTRSVSGLNDLVEQARMIAASQNTYVWLGLVDDANGLTVAMVASKSGDSDLSPANLRMVNRIVFFEKVKLSDDVASTYALKDSADTALLDSVGDSDHGQFTAGNNLCFKKIIRFSPLGEASIKQGTTSRWLEIGLSPLQANSPNVASLQVSGMGGNVRVLRK